MKHKAFTLIELLVTMGIIAVLAGMAVFNFNQSRMRARDVQRKNDLGQLKNALELYKIDTRAYPDDSTDFQDILLGGGYTKVTFNDPKGTDWATNNYDYKNGTDTMSYYLMACLENKADSVRATVSQCGTFPNGKGAGSECVCGDSDTGVMYIVNNP